MFQIDWIPCSNYGNIWRLKNQYVWGDLYNYLITPRIIPMTMDKIFKWAIKIMRQMTTNMIWNWQPSHPKCMFHTLREVDSEFKMSKHPLILRRPKKDEGIPNKLVTSHKSAHVNKFVSFGIVLAFDYKITILECHFDLNHKKKFIMLVKNNINDRTSPQFMSISYTKQTNHNVTIFFEGGEHHTRENLKIDDTCPKCMMHFRDQTKRSQC